MWLLAGCARPPTAEDPGPADPPDADTVAYAQVVTGIESTRQALAARHAPREEARAALLDAVAVALIPRWLGTGWDFYGTAPEPGAGDIACGHFVGTVLHDAGFRVDRLAVGRLPSESILGLFAAPAQRHRFRNATPAAIVAALADLPDGVYGAGFDFHAGLLVKRGGPLRFCHASPYADAVVCEDPATSPGFRSKYVVVGPLLTDDAVDTWLAGEHVPVPGE